MKDTELVKDIKVENVEELESLFGRAYWIESEFEQSFQWQAYTALSEEYRDIVFRLSHDSEGHKAVLTDIIQNLNDVSMDRIKENQKQRDFQFKSNWQDSEIFTEILKYEFLVKDIYKRIKNHTSEELIKDIWDGKNLDEFFLTMKYLIEQEDKHVNLIKPHAGNIKRIR